MISRCLGIAVTIGCATIALGCSASRTVYETKTTLHVNQAANLWTHANYKYVKIGLEASANAKAGSEASKSLGRQAMDNLVAKARLTANQALVDVTLETGTVADGSTLTRIVTLRGDVIEFVPEEGTK